MALLKKEVYAVVPIKSVNQSKKTNVVILDEDSYTERIERIIERDFFPDLPTLSVQKDYFDALEKNDLVKLRELQMKYGGKCPTTNSLSSVYNTPSSFETPQTGPLSPGSTNLRTQSVPPENTHKEHELGTQLETNREKKLGAKQDNIDAFSGLDSFLAKHTSEDNASFDDILTESERKRQDKHAWLFEKESHQEEEHLKKLQVPSLEEQATIQPRPVNLDTWTYKPHNAVMYVPEGVEFSAKELIDMKKHKGRVVKHINTRFVENPFATTSSKQVLQKAAVYKALVNQGKIGHDGRELQTTQSPQVNGYKFVSTPSPAPGVEDSPFMTWGEIEGTPVHLDATEIHPSLTPGPVFKIPEVPKRDQLALALAEKNSKAHRAKKEAAIKQVTRRLASPSPSMSPLERLSGMSPAAQRLASKRLGVRTHTDSALRASYSPSPSRTPGENTPVHLSVASPVLDPSLPGCCGIDKSNSNQTTPKRGSSVSPSLTDNLLNLPKRQKAADFF